MNDRMAQALTELFDVRRSKWRLSKTQNLTTAIELGGMNQASYTKRTSMEK